jgi:amino acid permease
MLGLFYFGSVYYLAIDNDGGWNRGELIDWKDQLNSLATVFGNTVFVFIYHHSIPGIMYPVRPQSSINRMFLISNIVGASMLALEGQLAFWAFGSLKNECKNFPCTTQKLYNENF